MNTKADRNLESRVPAGSPGPDEPVSTGRTGINGLQSGLERALIEEYLAARGHTLRSLAELPLVEREPMLRAATTSATLKLAEIEARAHLLDSMAQ